MDLLKCVVFYVWCYWCVLNIGNSGAVDITVTPQDACVCSEQPVQFNCTAVVERTVAGGGTTLQTAAQRWEIATSESTVMVVSEPMASIPAGYEFVSVNSVPAGRPTGLRVLSPDISLNHATFTCIGYDPNLPSIESDPTPAVTLEVAESPEFQCSVSCPLVYSSDNNSCTVQWTTPVTASCESVTGFTVTVSGNGVTMNSSTQDAASLSYMTGPLEPFQSYIATVTAMSSCGSSSQCSESFVSPKEEKPAVFGVELQFIATDSAHVVIAVQFPMDSLRVRELSIVVRDDSDQEVLRQSFPGNSSSLSLDISSLQQCMNYTVSVTATNTGGSTTASATLFLNFITALDVLCVVGDADCCYLEATYVTDHPELVNVCTLNYMREGGPVNTVTQTHSTSSDRITLRATVPCENQTIVYEGYVHMNTLGCTHSGMTVCTNVICPPLPSLPHGSVSYSSVSVGSMAVYSCDTGYLLEGDSHELCQNNGQWSGAQPHCKDNVSPWFGVSIFLLICFVLSMIVIVALTLKMFVDRRKRSGSHSVRGGSSRTTHETVELSENVCYGPVAPPQSGATQTVEYEEIGALTTTTTGKTPAEKK